MAEFGGFTVEETEIPGLLTVEIPTFKDERGFQRTLLQFKRTGAITSKLVQYEEFTQNHGQNT